MADHAVRVPTGVPAAAAMPRLLDGLPVRLSRGLAFLGLLLVGVLTRAPAFDTVITTDESYWMQRSTRFTAALARGDWAATYRSGHPGVTTMWAGVLGMGPTRLEEFLPPRFGILQNLEVAPGYLDGLAAARRAVAAVTIAAYVLSVALAWRLLGTGPGLLGGLLLLLDPYLVGMSRLLHVDALLAPLMLASALAGLVYWLRSRRPAYLLLSAVFGALALLTKAPALFVPLFFGLVGLVTTRPWRAPW
jgi:hypothetical protein